MTEHFKSLSCVVYVFAVSLLCGGAAFGQINNDNAPASEINSGIVKKSESVAAGEKDSADKSTVKAETSEVNPEEKNILKKTDAKIENKDTKQANKEEAAPRAAVKKEDQPAAAKDADGLLTITEGSYKYKRIPEINIPDDSDDADAEADHSKSQEVVISSGDNPDGGTGEDNTKGIFGVSKKTGDTIIIVTLLIIIIGVIIVLKFKSKGKDENVLRRFPRA